MRVWRCAGVLAGLSILALTGAANAETKTKKMVMAKDIPVAHTPIQPGGYGDTFPPPVLKDCTEPLVKGAPDLRGIWKLVDHNGKYPEPGEHLYHYVERIEQCGDRIVDMGGGTIMDGHADGTEKNGNHDVSVRDYKTPITVIVTYEDNVFVLRPVGGPKREVRRWLDKDGRMIWTRPDYGRMVLERIGGPNDPYTRKP